MSLNMKKYSELIFKKNQYTPTTETRVTKVKRKASCEPERITDKPPSSPLPRTSTGDKDSHSTGKTDTLQHRQKR